MSVVLDDLRAPPLALLLLLGLAQPMVGVVPLLTWGSFFNIVGNVNSAQANSELCNLISSTLLDCGLNKDQFTINISNRKIVQGLIDDLKISEDKQLKVISNMPLLTFGIW